MYRLLRSRNYSPVGYYRGMATTEFETVQKMTEEQLGKVICLAGLLTGLAIGAVIWVGFSTLYEPERH
jgi:hypothetical protein